MTNTVLNKQQIIEVLDHVIPHKEVAEKLADQILALDDWIPVTPENVADFSSGDGELIIRVFHGKLFAYNLPPLPEPPTKEE